MLAVLLIVLGIVCRFVFDVPNFTPIAAIALFGGVHLSKKSALILPLAIIVISDLMIGMHATVLFVWGSILLISFLALKFREKINIKNVILYSLVVSVLFYLITNFGVWIMGGWYPKTFKGFLDCYYMGIPFFRNFLLGTVGYSFVFFGVYEWVEARFSASKPSYYFTI